MTPEQRGEAAFYVPPGQNPAAPELVAHVACGIRALEMTTRDPAVIKLSRDGIAVVRRLLDTAVAVADDSPDDGLTADDLLRLCDAAGLDLAQDIAAAETLRDAEQLAGAR
jgi:hypothetical protein